FSDLSTGNPTGWDWSFGDGNFSSAQNPVHTYLSSGTYNVCLQVFNECGQDLICEEFTVQDCGPVDPVNDIFDMCQPGPANFPILFNDFIGGSYTVSIVSPPSNGTATINAFDELVYTPNPGFTGVDVLTYELCNLCGDCGTATVTITVEDAPVANFTGMNSGSSYAFMDASTGNPTSWSWDFGDGNSSTLQNPTHTYAGPGNYTVCLTVANDCGQDQICEDYPILDCEPVDPVFDQFFMCQPGPATFPILANDFIASPILVNIATPPSNGTAIIDAMNNLEYTPNTGFVGNDTLTYQLCNLCGNCGTAMVIITVEDVPVANFSGPITGNTVNFTDLSTGNPTSWSWDFGDGNTSTLQNPTHTYGGPGNYTVCLTVANDCGQDQICEDYPIQDCEPVDPIADFFTMCQPGPEMFPILANDFIGGGYTVSIESPPSNGTATINGADELVYTPDPILVGNDTLTYELCNNCGQCGTAEVIMYVNRAPLILGVDYPSAGLTATFEVLTFGDITSWSWDFGDGNSSTLENPTHTYAAGGTYNVCITVSNECGQEQDCFEIVVEDCDPPLALDDNFAYCLNDFNQFDLFANDQFVLPNIGVNIITPPVHGTINWINQSNGIFEYLPTTYTNIDSFEYQVETDCGITMAWAYLTCQQSGGGVIVDPKIILSGFFDEVTGTMRPDLFTQQLLPLEQPFTGEPWNYQGDEAADSYLQFGDPSLCAIDWILVAIIDPFFPDDIVELKAGILWSDGCIRTIDGNSIQFDAPNGDYYVSVLPRNHGGICTLNPLSLNNDQATVVDFRDPLTDTYGGASDRIPAGPFEGVPGGDANGDGAINSVDLNLFWRPQNGAAPSYDNQADFNGDGAVNSVDLNAHFRPNNGWNINVPYTWPND
ncbi:MAG: PKD domain-containing protein, partial [Bacteroidota bacterium]